jgi:hypothetical protein
VIDLNRVLLADLPSGSDRLQVVAAMAGQSADKFAFAEKKQSIQTHRSPPTVNTKGSAGTL